MSILDKNQGCLILRIVYTGAAHSGKTATVKHLAQLVLNKNLENDQETVYSPSSAQGRTLYFDWFDYQAGIFHDYRIRCQIISVPGQNLLKSRRQQLLEGADATILMIDSSETDLKGAKQHYQELTEHRALLNKPPVLVIQANKQDLANSYSPDDIRDQLNIAADIPIMACVATESIGIRETFIKTVGLAIAQANILFEQNLLEIASPTIDSAADLLQLIQSQEQAIAANNTPTAVIDNQADNDKPESLAFAKCRLGAGFVWPPIAGRQLFRDLQDNNPKIAKTAHYWHSQLQDWHLQTDHLFQNSKKAKRHWIKILKQYNQLLPQLSPDYAIFLLKTELDNWCLWHINRSGNLLIDEITSLFATLDYTNIVKKLLIYTEQFLKLHQYFSDFNKQHLLELTDISQGTKGLYFHGFLQEKITANSSDVTALQQWHQQLKQHIPMNHNIDIPQLLNRLTDTDADQQWIETLSAWLIGE